MTHPSIRDLYTYWNKIRGAHAAPARVDVDPAAVPHVLADTFLLGSDAMGNLVFRLAGTRVCALLCRELKGESFVALFETGSARVVGDLLGIIGSKLIVVTATVSCRRGRAAAELELLMLPLRHGGRTDSRIIGALAPTIIPCWLGAKPANALSLGMHQYIVPIGGVTVASPAPAVAKQPRHGLFVIKGGRSNSPTPRALPAGHGGKCPRSGSS